MLLETLSPSPRRTRAQNGVGLLPKEAATGRASPSRPRSAQPSGLVSPLVGGGREGAVGVAFLEAPPVRPPCRRTVRCFAPPRWMYQVRAVWTWERCAPLSTTDDRNSHSCC